MTDRHAMICTDRDTVICGTPHHGSQKTTGCSLWARAVPGLRRWLPRQQMIAQRRETMPLPGEGLERDVVDTELSSEALCCLSRHFKPLLSKWR